MVSQLVPDKETSVKLKHDKDILCEQKDPAKKWQCKGS